MIDILEKDLEENILEIIKRYKLEKYKILNTDNYYDHMTFSVNSLSDFIYLIGKLSLIIRDSPLYTMLYRGMSNAEWELIPSLLRLSASQYDLEHNLALDFISEEPKLFENSKSNFEKLTKMQHFGIPTRLLDFTTNSLVALFFACSENFTKAGRVVFTINTLHYFNDALVESISSLYLYDFIFNISVDKWLNKNSVSVEDYLYSMYKHENSLLFVKPIYLDQRMEVQKSVFLLFNNYIRDIIADDIYYDFGNRRNTYNFNITKEMITKIYQKQIKSPIIKFYSDPMFVVQVDSFNEMIELHSKEINNSKDFFSSRFLLMSFIEKINMNNIWFNFSSIIIPARKKKEILFELKNIGIDKAFIYPETENIANRIKNRYI